jgi:5-formyltetrahydrofolate cyclo-ligase
MSPKRALRHSTKTSRDLICADDRRAMSHIIAENLFNQPEYINAVAILFYAAFGSEVPTQRIMEKSLADGKTVVLPITDTASNKLILRKVNNLSCLVKNKFGIPEPDPANTDPFEARDIDLVLVPGIVFDEKGWRIGYGGGYYDRFLSRLEPDVPWLAIAFEIQIVPEIPSESHDLPVDKIITEKRIIDTRKMRGQTQ